MRRVRLAGRLAAMAMSCQLLECVLRAPRPGWQLPSQTRVLSRKKLILKSMLKQGLLKGGPNCCYAVLAWLIACCKRSEEVCTRKAGVDCRVAVWKCSSVGYTRSGQRRKCRIVW